MAQGIFEKSALLCKQVLDWVRRQFRLVRVGFKRQRPMFVGVGGSKLFLAIIVLILLLPQKDEGEWSWRLWSLITAPPNEIGDAVAGVAGALAFLWIIVTVMLQSKELAAQREVLRLTRDEMEEQRKATQDMARSLAAQASIFEDEKKSRDEGQAAEQMHQLLRNLQHPLKRGAFIWSAEPPDSVRPRAISLDPEYRAKTGSLALEDYVGQLARVFADNQQRICNLVEGGHRTSLPSRYPMETFLSDLDSLIEVSKNLSAAQSLKFRRLDVYTLRTVVGAYLDADIWSDGRG